MSLLTSSMAPNILLRYITLVPNFEGKILKKYSLGELILLARTKEHILSYIPEKFQGVWMTKCFRISVFYRSLKEL